MNRLLPYVDKHNDSIEIPSLAPEISGDDLLTALQMARVAGEIIIKWYGNIETIHQKGHADLVCNIDTTAEQAMLEKLYLYRPNDVVISEETNSHQAETERCWLIGPLDATSAYIHRMGTQFPSVMIALREKKQTTLGVVFFPLTREWFYAVKGKGAYKNNRRLDVRKEGCTELLREAYVDVNLNRNRTLQSDEVRLLHDYFYQPGNVRDVSTLPAHSGIGVRLAAQDIKISAVVHDNNSEKPKQEPWDIAPVQCIVEEAGGIVCNLKGKKHNPFEPEPFLIATLPEIAQQILKPLCPLR